MQKFAFETHSLHFRGINFHAIQKRLHTLEFQFSVALKFTTRWRTGEVISNARGRAWGTSTTSGCRPLQRFLSHNIFFHGLQWGSSWHDDWKQQMDAKAQALDKSRVQLMIECLELQRVWDDLEVAFYKCFF